MFAGVDLTLLQPGTFATVFIYVVSLGSVLAGLWMLRNRPVRLFVLAAFVVLPVVALVVLPWRMQIFEAKHLAFLSPVLIVPASVAAGRYSCRPAAWAGVVLLAGLNVFALSVYYDDGFEKERWPSAADFIAERTSPADAVIFNPGYLRYAFARYYDGPALIRIENVRTLDRIRFGRLWLITERDSNVAPPNPAVTAAVKRQRTPVEFHLGYAGEKAHSAVFSGYKGDIVIRLFE
jgi:hypothetical protein